MKRSPSRRYTASKEASLLELLAQEVYPNLSKREIKRGIENKGCLVGSRPHTFAAKSLRKGTKVEIYDEAFSAKAPELSRVIFEDDHICVYDKPAGVVCEHPLQVHRLDKETSGVYMVAKNEEMHEKMCALFKQRKIQKKYIALVTHPLSERGGKIEGYLAVKKRLSGQKIWGSAPQGLYARTDWKLLESGIGYSKVSLTPETGRMHQIRVHMAEMGHPVLGDYQYGRAFPFHILRHMLHALSVTFTHPITGKRLTLHAEAPF